MPNGNPFTEEKQRRQQNPFSVEKQRRQTEVRATPEAPQGPLVPNLLGVTERRFPPTRAQLQEQTGVSNVGAPVTARVAETFGGVTSMERVLAEHFDVTPEELDIGQVEGLGLVFKNPETGDYTLVDPTGLDVGDITTVLREAPIIAGEAIGGIAGGARFGPSGAVAGAAAGASAGRYATLKGTQILGLNDLTDAEILAEAALEGGFAAAGGALPSGARFARGKLSANRRAAERIGDLVTNEELAQANINATDLAANIKARTGVEPQFTAGQAVTTVSPQAGAELQAVEKGLERIGRGDEITATRATQERAKQALTREVGASGDLSQAERVGEEIQFVSAQQREQALERIRASTDQIKARLDDSLNEIVGPTDIEAGETIREVLQEGRNAVFRELGEQYDTIGRELGAEEIDLSGFRKAAAKWEATLKRDILPSLSPEDSRIIEDAVNAGLDETVDFGTVQRAISDLRAEIRSIEKGISPRRQINAYRDLLEALEGARNASLEGVDNAALEQLVQLEADYAAAKTRIDRGLVGSVLKKAEGGGYQVANDRVLDTMLRQPTAMQDYLKAAADYPELNARDALKSAIYGKYRDDVIDGAIRHETFIRRHRASMEQVFSPKEMGKFGQAGRTVNAIRQAERTEADLIRDLDKRFEYRLLNYDPEAVLDQVAGSVSRTRKLKTLLKSHPEKWNNYKELRKRKLLSDMSSADAVGNVELDYNKIIGVIDRDRGELGILYGDQFKKDLGLLSGLLKTQKFPREMATELSQVLADNPKASAPILVFRALFARPLSRAGLVTTSVLKLDRSGVQRAVATILSDPMKLNRALRYRNATTVSKAMVNTLSAIGATGIAAYLREQEGYEGSSVPEIDLTPIN